MSHEPLETTFLPCQIETALSDPRVALGSLCFVEQVLLIQADEAVDELGDSLIGGYKVVRTAQSRAGTNIDEGTAVSLANAVSTCLQQRYLRNCHVSGKCSGRESIDKTLANLGILHINDMNVT